MSALLSASVAVLKARTLSRRQAMKILECVAVISVLLFFVFWIAMGVLVHTRDMLDSERERFFSRIPFTRAWAERRLRKVERTKYRDSERRVWVTVQFERYPWETDSAPSVQLAAQVRKAVHSIANIYED